MKPLISVITLTYKNYDRLFDTIQSVIDQDYPNIEYIISDDGSGDFPEDDVRRFIENNKSTNFMYKIIINDINLGTVKNFNNAINNSKGDYIFPLACNDIFVKSTIISEIAEVFDETNCKMVITSRIKYKNSKPISVIPHVGDRKKIALLDSKKKKYRAMLLTEHYGMFIGCNMYYERNMLEKYELFDEKYKLLEDLPILEKVLWDDDVELRPEIISIYYDGDTGVTLKKSKVHSVLEKDINRFNLIGKTRHLGELDYKTNNHVRFGIDRVNADSYIKLFFVCIRYCPRILSYLFYCVSRTLIGIKDKKYIKKHFDK